LLISSSRASARCEPEEEEDKEREQDGYDEVALDIAAP
jgi:hypothetical protein